MPAASHSSRGSTGRRCTRPCNGRSQALENLEHRGAAGADPSTGDGAGILLQIPDAFFRAGRRRGAAAARSLRRRDVLPAARGGTAWRARVAARGDRRGGRAGRRVLARRPGRPGASSAAPPRDRLPLIRQLVVAAGGVAADDQDAFERKLYVIRRRFELELGRDAIVPSFSSRTIVYKGMLTAPQLRGYYPDLAGRAHGDGARPRPLALLDEHVPELGARASVPDDRPQRRDQHRARERQLDARPRVAARLRALRRRPPQGAARSSSRADPTRRRSTTCSSCSSSAAARCRTR